MISARRAENLLSLGFLVALAGCGSSGSHVTTDAGATLDARADAKPDAHVHSDGGRADAGHRDAASRDAREEAGDAAPPTRDGSTDAGDVVDLTVTVLPGTKLGTIGAGFAGLSYEKDHLNDGFFTPTNTDLIGLFKRLGTSVLRIGGNSVDTTTWSATGAGDTTGVIAPPDVAALKGFIAATGWSVIYGVNMAADDPTAAAAEATNVEAELGTSLYGFEIGNECDLYSGNGDRPTSWTYADFDAQWKTFYSPMHSAASTAAFTGPASAGNVTNWTVPFAADEASVIVLLTQHYYRGNGMSPMSTLAELLLPDQNLITELGELATAATSNHIARGYRLSEANSFYNGGASGISDAYGTALWVIDFLFTNARYGSSGVNFHGGGDGMGYTPIADLDSVVVEARPDYYGMLLFTLAGQGPLVETDVATTTLNFTAYAVTPTGGETNVVLVNKDPTATVRATVDLGASATQAATTLLTGPSLGSTTGYTLGGVAVGKDGTWTPVATPSMPVTNMKLTVEVPPASALLVHAS
jgi:hypothetical protein